MQYKEILLQSGNENYQSIDDYISRNNCEHTLDRQLNVRILGIPETYKVYQPDVVENILTDKGYLFVRINEMKYHEYHVFAEPSSTNFGHVLIINEPIDVKTSTYENTHKFVMVRNQWEDSSHVMHFYYVAQPIIYGTTGAANGSQTIHSLDVDGYIYGGTQYFPDEDGFFRVSHSPNSIRYLLISYKQYMYINVSPAENVLVKFVNRLGDEISLKAYKFDDVNYYIDDSHLYDDEENPGTEIDPDEGLDISAKTAGDSNQYLYFSFEGEYPNSSNKLPPEQILVEVY